MFEMTDARKYVFDTKYCGLKQVLNILYLTLFIYLKALMGM